MLKECCQGKACKCKDAGTGQKECDKNVKRSKVMNDEELMQRCEDELGRDSEEEERREGVKGGNWVWKGEGTGKGQRQRQIGPGRWGGAAGRGRGGTVSIVEVK